VNAAARARYPKAHTWIVSMDRIAAFDRALRAQANAKIVYSKKGILAKHASIAKVPAFALPREHWEHRGGRHRDEVLADANTRSFRLV
jgi:hypothetical protein